MVLVNEIISCCNIFTLMCWHVGVEVIAENISVFTCGNDE
jgi:hypothetical protein